ncbi:hypothetical protein EW026_g7965 [Hermanssonia centrifuga]|uniref:Autophagy-related protein n=1 Tax=Hermanssonia centrifuga TaxID=98765 RepID=A0A4S4KAE6_9APHY|nr:hypothetical protein EW026_g7965 [Hermanssonia centrifuga]
MGNIADHPPHRKRLLLAFAFFGSLAATLFLLLPSSSPIWPASALLGLQKRLEQTAVEARNGDESDFQNEPLLADEGGHVDEEEVENLRKEYNTALSRATSRISSQGIAFGYAAGILMLFVALVPVTLLHGTTFSLRLAIGLSGIWWALFSLPAAAWLPSSSLASKIDSENDAEAAWVEEEEENDGKREWSTRREIIGAWKRLGGMLRWREIKRLRYTFQYLAAWFLLSDGSFLVIRTAILFGKTTLHMPPSSLILIGIISPCAGIVGSLLWPKLQRRFVWSNLTVIVVLNGSVKFGGLTTPGEMYGLAVYFGTVYGAFQGYARAFYSELIPTGEEARWYALFSITDKSSSFVGPLVVGLIADTTGNIRYAFFFLTFMVWAAIPVLMSIDVEHGRKDARSYRYKG